MFVRAVVPEKAFAPILSTPSGISIVVNAEQPEKAFAPIELPVCTSSSIAFKEAIARLSLNSGTVGSAGTSGSGSVVLSLDIVKLVNPVQPENALSPIVIKLAGISIEVKETISLKASSAIEVTFFASSLTVMVAGITRAFSKALFSLSAMPVI